jgi:NifU-like protein involved in Fe-S cluster formation
LWLNHIVEVMNDDLQKRIEEALKNPQNLGELPEADSVGTVGNSQCGEMLRMWIKYKEERGRKVIDKATFQSFGCETAIAVASLATELIKGKTAEEALSLGTNDLAGELGPLPPMKIHCAELVQGALRSALEPQAAQPTASPDPAIGQVPGLLETFNKPKEGGVKVVFLNQRDEQGGK